MMEMVQAALREVDLSPEQASAFKAALARQACQLTTAPVGRGSSAGICSVPAGPVIWCGIPPRQTIFIAYPESLDVRQTGAS